jgi:formate/nitrite transporter FocA (FNT family)
MQKLIDNAITVFLGLVIGSLFFFVVQAKAEPPNYDQHNYTRPSPHQVPEKSNVNTAIDDVINLILKQGFAGAIIVCLGVWTFRTDKVNRAMQKENIDKFVAISAECSGHMASVSARLENIEREIEQSKAIEMMTARKG